MDFGVEPRGGKTNCLPVMSREYGMKGGQTDLPGKLAGELLTVLNARRSANDMGDADMRKIGHLLMGHLLMADDNQHPVAPDIHPTLAEHELWPFNLRKYVEKPRLWSFLRNCEFECTVRV
jgi:hypothetical protein